MGYTHVLSDLHRGVVFAMADDYLSVVKKRINFPFRLKSNKKVNFLFGRARAMFTSRTNQEKSGSNL